MSVMKRNKLIWMAVVAAVALGQTSCLNSDSDFHDEAAPVRPGIYIYNAAHSQNEAAMQPADVALRLAVLRAEAEKQGKTGDLNSVTVDGQNVKTLLFGMYTQIAEDESEAGTYVIEYRNSGGQRPYDIYSRTGTVRVKTQGVALERTDAAKRWSVSLGSEKLAITGGSSVAVLSTGETELYFEGGVCRIGFSNALSEADGRKASWSGDFELTTEMKEGLSFSGLKDASFELDGSARGTSFWSFNGTTSAAMSYTVTDGKYQPSRTGSPSTIMGGTELCGLTSPMDYNPADYPSSEVKVVWTVSGNMLSYAVTYNGTTVNF